MSELVLEPFIQTLPKESVQLLEEVDLNGVAQKEYADKLGISYSTLKSRMQKISQSITKNI